MKPRELGCNQSTLRLVQVSAQKGRERRPTARSTGKSFLRRHSLVIGFINNSPDRLHQLVRQAKGREPAPVALKGRQVYVDSAIGGAGNNNALHNKADPSDLDFDRGISPDPANIGPINLQQPDID
jgi:hypothetical protein